MCRARNMIKFLVLMLGILLFCGRAYALEQNIEYPSVAIYINAGHAGIRSIGLSEKNIKDFVKENYQEEDAFLKESLNQNFVDRLYIAPISDTEYIFIVYSSLNCGTVGCFAKIYTRKGDKLEYVMEAEDTYDCQNLEGFEDIYVCKALQIERKN